MSLKQDFETTIKFRLQKELGLKNPLAVPTIKKVVVSIGVGSHRDDANYLPSASKDLEAITGQRPAPRSAKKAIAGFKVRQGQIVGLQVTLRGQRMWDFFEKLVKIVFPRTKDFRGISKKSLDSCGSITVGIADHTVFPEIDANKVDKIKSLGVVVGTNAKDKDTGYKLLKALGFPFKD